MSKKNAVMLILLGGTFMSFVGLYMRLLTDANGFQILFYRSPFSPMRMAFRSYFTAR